MEKDDAIAVLDLGLRLCGKRMVFVGVGNIGGRDTFRDLVKGVGEFLSVLPGSHGTTPKYDAEDATARFAGYPDILVVYGGPLKSLDNISDLDNDRLAISLQTTADFFRQAQSIVTPCLTTCLFLATLQSNYPGTAVKLAFHIQTCGMQLGNGRLAGRTRTGSNVVWDLESWNSLTGSDRVTVLTDSTTVAPDLATLSALPGYIERSLAMTGDDDEIEIVLDRMLAGMRMYLGWTGNLLGYLRDGLYGEDLIQYMLDVIIGKTGNVEFLNHVTWLAMIKGWEDGQMLNEVFCGVTAVAKVSNIVKGLDCLPDNTIGDVIVTQLFDPGANPKTTIVEASCDFTDPKRPTTIWGDGASNGRCFMHIGGDSQRYKDEYDRNQKLLPTMKGSRALFDTTVSKMVIDYMDMVVPLLEEVLRVGYELDEQTTNDVRKALQNARNGASITKARQYVGVV